MQVRLFRSDYLNNNPILLEYLAQVGGRAGRCAGLVAASYCSAETSANNR
jgi:hypothetical protein